LCSSPGERNIRFHHNSTTSCVHEALIFVANIKKYAAAENKIIEKNIAQSQDYGDFTTVLQRINSSPLKRFRWIKKCQFQA